MSSPKLYEKQSISLADVDLSVGLLDYGDEPMEEYDVIRGPEVCGSGLALELSSLDMAMPRNWMNINYMFENVGKHKDFMSPSKLKASLPKALEHIPALAGRLRSDDGSSGMSLVRPKAPTHIILNNKGAWFTHRTTKISFKDMRTKYINTAHIPSQFMFKRFTEAARESRDHQVDAPLLAIKAVYFDCGSVSLSVYINHQVADGRGMYEFVRLWGQITRGVTPDPLVDSRHVAYKFPKLDGKEAEKATERLMNNKPYQPLMTDMQVCRLTIPDTKLKQLKAEINSKLAPNWVSSDDLFYCVHLRMLLRARKVQDTGIFTRTINIRQNLGLDNSAFGNFCNAPFFGPFDQSSIVDLPLERAVLEVRRQLDEYKKEKWSNLTKEIVSVSTNAIPNVLDNLVAVRDSGCTSITSYDPSRVNFHDSPAFYLATCYYLSGSMTMNPICDGLFNGLAGIDLEILHTYVNDAEARELGFTATPLMKVKL